MRTIRNAMFIQEPYRRRDRRWSYLLLEEHEKRRGRPRRLDSVEFTGRTQEECDEQVLAYVEEEGARIVDEQGRIVEEHPPVRGATTYPRGEES